MILTTNILNMLHADFKAIRPLVVTDIELDLLPDSQRDLVLAVVPYPETSIEPYYRNQTFTQWMMDNALHRAISYAQAMIVSNPDIIEAHLSNTQYVAALCAGECSKATQIMLAQIFHQGSIFIDIEFLEEAKHQLAIEDGENQPAYGLVDHREASKPARVIHAMRDAKQRGLRLRAVPRLPKKSPTPPFSIFPAYINHPSAP
jgi:hypothetical protein